MVVADSFYVATEEDSGARSAYLRFKILADALLSLVLLIPALPVIGLLVLLIRLTSRGPGIYRQVRVGRNGRPFTLYKLRTMRHDAEAQTGPVWAIANDPRTTAIGRFLRRSHLDELPQLFNVLKGEMCFVGPRPERPEFVVKLARAVPNYCDRLSVRPGVTGLAQVYLEPDSDLQSVVRKLTHDVHYIQTATPTLDAKLMGCTALRLVGLPGWVARKVTRLDRCLEHLENGHAVTATRQAALEHDSERSLH